MIGRNKWNPKRSVTWRPNGSIKMGNLFDLLKEPGKYISSRPLFCEVWIACFYINWSSKIKVLKVNPMVFWQRPTVVSKGVHLKSSALMVYWVVEHVSWPLSSLVTVRVIIFIRLRRLSNRYSLWQQYNLLCKSYMYEVLLFVKLHAL